jgi:hypothetical protein
MQSNACWHNLGIPGTNPHPPDTIPIATPVQFNRLYPECDRAAPAIAGLRAHSG